MLCEDQWDGSQLRLLGLARVCMFFKDDDAFQHSWPVLCAGCCLFYQNQILCWQHPRDRRTNFWYGFDNSVVNSCVKEPREDGLSTVSAYHILTTISLAWMQHSSDSEVFQRGGRSPQTLDRSFGQLVPPTRICASFFPPEPYVEFHCFCCWKIHCRASMLSRETSKTVQL